jgi:hypothetical protein
MTKVHKISLVALIFALFIIIGAKPVFASQSSNDSFVPLKNLVLSSDEIRRSWGISPETILYQYDATSELSDLDF